MISWMKSIYRAEAFNPSLLIGLWINPFFIIRKGLVKGIKNIANAINGGKLLDVGCGSKPYEKFFSVDSYIGIDIQASGHDHQNSKIDIYYDGSTIPFDDNEFDSVFSSEVFEHVFNIDDLFREINRVLKKGGTLGFTCPFVWCEHEQPYDFARYTTFALEHLLIKHGFAVVFVNKSTPFFETVMQMLSAYVFQHCLPKNRWLKLILTPVCVAPINIFGVFLGKILPNNGSLYLNNIVVARKL